MNTSARRGRACGRGGSSRRRRLHSVVAREGAIGGEELRERMRGVRGVAWPSPWRREGVGEAATAKQEVEASACARACVLLRLCLLAEVEDSRSAPVGWTGAAGPATGKWPRYGSFSLSLFLIISVFYYSVNLGLY